MRQANNATRALPFILLGFLLASAVSRADQSDTHQTVEGIDIYIGVIPAEVVRGRGSEGEKRMHGGAPARMNRFHLVAALFDQGSGARITEAQVSATVTVTEPGLAGQRKPLEAMRISDAVTFGNYFALSDRATNRISLEIRVPGRSVVAADFEYLANGP